MIRFFKELLEVHADRWRYMFGVGSFWSIFIPLIIVAALVLNMIMTSKHQYTSDDLSESYSEGYNKACDEHASDYDEGYNSGYDDSFEETWDIAYDEGYSAAESDTEQAVYRAFDEGFSEGHHIGWKNATEHYGITERLGSDALAEYETSLISKDEFLAGVDALKEIRSSRKSD